MLTVLNATNDSRPEPEGGPSQPGRQRACRSRAGEAPRLGGRGWGASAWCLDCRRCSVRRRWFRAEHRFACGRRLRRFDPRGRQARVRVPRPTALVSCSGPGGPRRHESIAPGRDGSSPRRRRGPQLAHLVSHASSGDGPCGRMRALLARTEGSSRDRRRTVTTRLAGLYLGRGGLGKAPSLLAGLGEEKR